MVGPLEGFADVWSTVFLKQVYGFDGALAASLPLMIFIGMCFGGPVLSLVADKMGSYCHDHRSRDCDGSRTFCSAHLAFDFRSAQHQLRLDRSLLCVSILAIYKASTYVPEHIAGLTTAVANMIIMTFGYAFHTVIGAVVNAAGGPTGPKALVYGVTVIPIALCLGIAGFTGLFVQEKKQGVAVTSFVAIQISE